MKQIGKVDKMKKLKENSSIYASFQIPLCIKISMLLNLLAYQNHLIIGGLSTWRSRYERDVEKQKIYKAKLFVDPLEENPTIL